MREFRNKVAVITGAGSGIGRGMAGEFAGAGMHLVLADIEVDALGRAERELAANGAEVLAVPTDVSRRESVDNLCERAHERFGEVHVLCNNAGVAGGGGALWESSERDWSWVLGVNLMGVVHGIQAFVPRMLAHGGEGHIVNTSSVVGLSSGAGSVYSVSKHAVTRLSEGLHHDLRAAGSKLGVSVLCPGMIATRIMESDRNRPPELRNEGSPDPQLATRREQVKKLFSERGMRPERVGEIVLDAIRAERFYILTHPEIKARVEVRMRDILEERGPSPLPPAPPWMGGRQ